MQGIFEYTLTTWGVEQFHVYRRKLSRALEAIADDPMLLGSKDRSDLFEGCRFYRVEPHYVVYRQGRNCVEVGRVLHERMNFEMQVPDEGVFR